MLDCFYNHLYGFLVPYASTGADYRVRPQMQIVVAGGVLVFIGMNWGQSDFRRKEHQEAHEDWEEQEEPYQSYIEETPSEIDEGNEGKCGQEGDEGMSVDCGML